MKNFLGTFTILSLSTMAFAQHPGPTPANAEREAFAVRELKVAALEGCKQQMTDVLNEFSTLESAVKSKFADATNREALLPWTSSNEWEDEHNSETFERNSMKQSSAALVQISVALPDESTPFTRFEDFTEQPGHEISQGWDFRVGHEINSICKSEATSAASKKTRYGEQFKYDPIAQARLFEHYMTQFNQAAVKYGKLEEFKAQAAKVNASVSKLKEYVIEKRKAGLL